MKKHTLGLLKIGAPPPNGEQTIGTESGLMIAVATNGVDHPTEANARRLVACWNACDGISTENLTDNLPVKELAKRYNTALRRQGELMEALRHIEGAAMDITCDRRTIRDAARAAIAKATGETR